METSDHDLLAARFERSRQRLRAMAWRMLGSASEADDAVQEAWLRLSRSRTDDVDNLEGWLTTVVARVCLDMLRSRKARREEALDAEATLPLVSDLGGTDPEREAVLADAVGLALLVVLETLSPAERLAFVLHDMFAIPFDEIAPIVDRTPAATRQLASRARRRVQGAATSSSADLARQRTVVDAFLAAARTGDVAGLIALLDPEVVMRADRTAVEYGAQPEVRGPATVAGFFDGKARAARPAMVGGAVGVLWAPGGKPRVAIAFRIREDRIEAIELVADAGRLAELAPVHLP